MAVDALIQWLGTYRKLSDEEASQLLACLKAGANYTKDHVQKVVKTLGTESANRVYQSAGSLYNAVEDPALRESVQGVYNAVSAHVKPPATEEAPAAKEQDTDGAIESSLTRLWAEILQAYENLPPQEQVGVDDEDGWYSQGYWNGANYLFVSFNNQLDLDDMGAARAWIEAESTKELNTQEPQSDLHRWYIEGFTAGYQDTLQDILAALPKEVTTVTT